MLTLEVRFICLLPRRMLSQPRFFCRSLRLRLFPERSTIEK